MFRKSLMSSLILLLAFGIASESTAGVPQSSGSQSQTRPQVVAAGEDAEAFKQIRSKLAESVTLQFLETPLSDVIAFLKDYTQCNIILDRAAIEQEGVTNDTPVSVHVEAITLASALNHLLRPYNLTWIVQDECLLVTSKTAADEVALTRSYPVEDLAASRVDADRLLNVAAQVLMSSGRSTTERLIMVDALKALVLTDQASSHVLLQQLLQQLRGDFKESDTVKRIKAKLGEPVTLEFVETPLVDIVSFLRDYTGTNIIIDRAIEDQGVTPDTTLSIHVRSIELRSALTLLLRTARLAFTVVDEAVLITSEEAEQNQFDVRVYAVGKVPQGRSPMNSDDWKRLMAPIVRREKSAPAAVEGATPGAPAPSREAAITEIRPTVTFFEPTQSLIVYAPHSIHTKVEAIIGLVAKVNESNK
jgi:type II secretory pathway component GspD/PulD (secretin)